MFLRSAGEARVFSEGQRSASVIARPAKNFYWHKQLDGVQLPQPVMPRKYHARRYLHLLPAVISCLLILLTLGGGYSYYKNRIMNGVTVNTIDVGGKTKLQAKQLLSQSLANQTFSVSVDSKTLTVSPSDVGLTYNLQATVDKAFATERSPLGLFKDSKVPLIASIDDDTLQKFLTSTVNKVKQAPVSAKMQADNGKIVIIPEVKGQSFGIDPVQAKHQILSAASNGHAVTLSAKTFTSLPPITNASLQDAKKQAEKLLATPVAITIMTTTIKPTPTIIGTWLLFAADESRHTISVKADPVRISNYLDSVAKPFVNPPRSKVIVKNDDGTSRVLSEGAPGTDITDKKSAANELATSINSYQPFNKPLPVSYASPPAITAQEWPKWIDVDLTNHRMYAYRLGEVERTFLISAGAARTPTVKGQFAVKTKVLSQNMRGFNADGTTYFQPNVQYINYFYQDYAIHGNYWRPASVFGAVNTSHGCVGITNLDAKWMYTWATVGTPIIIHS